ncbi:hypothetical protein [Pedobacter caeni]|uniref:Uncharacterized protein n=1 Tax=Pedobacter caeni TaxID=288992 RepID=A0A1M5HEH7_9SPHI|nr:hypothetical protein [Pedobacter caeni]SHG14389.1 hypothetical protein SAMN04488522_104632 [Pedobacter caeni]
MSNLAGHGVLFLSAFAPAVIFIKLAMLQYNRLVASAVELPKKELLENHIRMHFQYVRKQTVRIGRGKDQIEGYFEAYPNGEYFFYSADHTELIRLRKDHLGWGLVCISDGDESKHKFVLPLILYLEARLFN